MTNLLVKRIMFSVLFLSRISYRRDLPLVYAALCHRRKYPIPGDIWHKVKNIGGWLTEKEAGLLYWASRKCPVSGSVIELGSYEGRSTGIFALAGRHVNAIDAWGLNDSDLAVYSYREIQPETVFNRFRKNLKCLRVKSLVSIHCGLSHQVGQNWTNKGAILYVDAGHSYEDVKCDLDTWIPHLHTEGFLLMHDVLRERFLGVTRAASELKNNGWRVIVSSGSVIAFKRK